MTYREIIVLAARVDSHKDKTFTLKWSYENINNIIFAGICKVGTLKPLYLYGELDKEPWCYEDIKYLEPVHIRFGFKRI